MKLFDGLYPYEIIMLLLGILLFIVLVYALVILVKRDKPYRSLLMFFAFPIIMIGYSGIQSIEISANLIKIEKRMDDLSKDMADTNALNALKQDLGKISGRRFSDTSISITIARAQVAIGHDTAAEARIERVLQKAPQLSAARELKEQINLQRKLVTLTPYVEQNPGDTVAKKELDETVRALTQRSIARTETTTNIARARKVLENVAAAKKILPPVTRDFPIYSIPQNSTKDVRAGTNCTFGISRGGYSSDSEARQDFSDTRFRIYINKLELMPAGNLTTFRTDNGANWHINQQFEIRNIEVGDHHVTGMTYSRSMGNLDSRSFIIRSR